MNNLDTFKTNPYQQLHETEKAKKDLELGKRLTTTRNKHTKKE